jgi:hypothetical protein
MYSLSIHCIDDREIFKMKADKTVNTTQGFLSRKCDDATTAQISRLCAIMFCQNYSLSFQQTFCYSYTHMECKHPHYENLHAHNSGKTRKNNKQIYGRF